METVVCYNSAHKSGVDFVTGVVMISVSPLSEEGQHLRRPRCSPQPLGATSAATQSDLPRSHRRENVLQTRRF